VKVFVAGATGVIGRELVPQLVARGHEVVGMTRTAAKQDGLRALGARPVVADALDLPDSLTERNLLATFSDAVEVGDAARLLTLLSSDARVTMPPQPLELIGHEAIGAFLDDRAEVRGAPLQLRPTRANGQPAFGYYLRSQPRGMMAHFERQQG
jgi:NAD(P)-dependent dehydrogenase (short-subunit alcohol dehydrogenase family)